MKTSTNPPAPRSEVIQTQEAEHRTIRGLVADLLKTRSGDALTPMLVELGTLLPEHFEHEEVAGGVFAGMVEQDPAMAGAVAKFVEEHLGLLAQLASTQQLLEHHPAAAVAQAHALAHAIAAHEKAENELMMHALYDELGEHD